MSASSDSAGVVTGAGVSGTIINGAVSLTFTKRVYLSSLRYDITETVTLSPPPELYGLNPLRIKNNGVVNTFTAWNTISVQDTQVQVVTNPAPAQTKTVRANARFVDITDAEGKSLWTLANTHYTWVKDTGVVTINTDFTGFTAPFVLTDTIGEAALVTEVGTNSLTLASPLSQVYPIGATVSSVQNLGDLQARIGTVRDMTAWDNNWELDGTPATGNMNTVDYPIEVRNDTSVNEDWVLIFTTPTSFRCVGRRLGQIATGDTLNDFTPVNPLTLLPYFIIRSGRLVVVGMQVKQSVLEVMRHQNPSCYCAQCKAVTVKSPPTALCWRSVAMNLNRQILGDRNGITSHCLSLGRCGCAAIN